MKKIGLEAEYFVGKIDSKVFPVPPVIVPKGIPVDESGILAEIRGKPGDIYEACGNFIAEYFRIKKLLKEFELEFLPYDRYKLSNELKLQLSRQYVKPLYKAYNIYNENRTHRKNKSLHYAGMHVHFSDNNEYIQHDGNGHIVNRHIIPGILNIPIIVKKMDEKYSDLIKAVYRNRGCYELKDDHFEYRSLPTMHILSLEDIEAIFNLAEFAWSLF